MSESDRTSKWREKRRAEGKKSFTILLSEEAQQIIKSEKETTGENYSAIVERALTSIKRPRHQRVKFQPISSPRPARANENVTSNNTDVKNIPILIDDLQNYELNETAIDPYKAVPGFGLNKKENLFSRLVKSKFSGKKRWFR